MLATLIILLAALNPCWAVTSLDEDQLGPIVRYERIAPGLAFVHYDRPSCR